MPERKSDSIRLRHMLEATTKAIRFTVSKERTDLVSDEQLGLALVRLVEIIGEAASKVTEETRGLDSEIPWKNIVATRNRLIHAYEMVDEDILWQIVRHELPILAERLSGLLNRLEATDQENLFSLDK